MGFRKSTSFIEWSAAHLVVFAFSGIDTKATLPTILKLSLSFVAIKCHWDAPVEISPDIAAFNAISKNRAIRFFSSNWGRA